MEFRTLDGQIIKANARLEFYIPSPRRAPYRLFKVLSSRLPRVLNVGNLPLRLVNWMAWDAPTWSVVADGYVRDGDDPVRIKATGNWAHVTLEFADAEKASRPFFAFARLETQ